MVYRRDRHDERSHPSPGLLSAWNDQHKTSADTTTTTVVYATPGTASTKSVPFVLLEFVVDRDDSGLHLHPFLSDAHAPALQDTL